MIPRNITRGHITKALGEISRREIPPRRGASKFQLVVEGQVFPPKYVVSVANKYANGVELDPSKFNGGAETNTFLRNLGFDIEGISPPRRDTRQKSIHKTNDKQVRVGSDPVTQKQALLNLLKRRFGVVKTEANFDWLVVPDWSSMDSDLMKVAEALAQYRGYRGFFSPGIHLDLDYFIPSQKVIIEYDEKQHFTIPRAIAISNYPAGLGLGFDKSAWISACETTKATDRAPEYRDEQRAFYDSLRDILASRNGISIIRIKHGDFDWTSEEGVKVIGGLLSTDQCASDFSITNGTIEEISQYYAELQQRYREWARQFKVHEEVIQWLKDNKINAKKVKKQRELNLLSSDWNSVTIPILRTVASNCLEQMKFKFNNLFDKQTEADMGRIWYLLFFIHPGRHELWYFEQPPKGGKEGHFPQGYPRRLAWLLRSHRQGLKAAKTYLNGKGAVVVGQAIGNRCVKAYSTAAFRHIHLHPTTMQWQVSEINDLCATVRQLQIGEDALSLQEQSAAIALSKRANFDFDKWINYAQCAINEGPIFLLKEGKLLPDCLRDTVQALNSERISQSVLRDILSRYHIVNE